MITQFEEAVQARLALGVDIIVKLFVNKTANYWRV